MSMTDGISIQVPNGATQSVSIGFTWSQDSLEFLPHPGQESSGDEESSSSASEPPQEAQQTEAEQERSSEKPHQSASVDDRPDHLKWKGRQISFMKANEHSRERQGKWDVSKLDGAAKTIVEGDEKGAK